MNDDNSINECQTCKKFILSKNDSRKSRIIADLRDLKNTLADLAYLLRPKFWYQILKQKEWLTNVKPYLEKYENIKGDNEEHAIFIVYNTNSDKNLFAKMSGIDILIEYFESSSKKFKLFGCYDAISFQNEIEKTSAQNLWILGHGNRHGVFFGSKNADYFPFCNMRNTTRRSFVAQLHCCDGIGKTLWEYISDKPGIFSEGSRIAIQNRDDIEKWISNDKM